MIKYTLQFFVGMGSGGSRNSGGSSSGSKSNPVTAALAKEEDSIRNNSYETGIVIRADGSRALRKEGTESEVKFSKADLAIMKDATFTHNHPEGTTFSSADLDLVTRSGMKEMRVVHSNGYYSLTRVSNNKNKNNFSKDYSEAMRQEGNRLSLNVTTKQQFDTGINKFRSNWLKQNSGKYGYEYKEGLL